MLYHYTGEKGLLGILSSKSIWLVSSKEMSDITDRFYGNLFATIALLKSNNENVKLLREHLSENDILDVNMQTFKVDFYSASFCGRNDNDYLWQKYADFNKGFCIEIDEQILSDYMNEILVSNYEGLDKDDEIVDSEKDVILPRNVSYDYPIEKFLDIVKETKKLSISDDDISNPNANSIEHYKNWLLYTLIILSGVIKGKDYKKEEEIRFLYQNRYTEDYIKEHFIYALNKTRFSKAFEILGLSQEIKDDKKRRLELNLKNSFSSKLIPTIIVGNEYNGNIETLKSKLIEAGLKNTKIIDRAGKEL